MPFHEESIATKAPMRLLKYQLRCNYTAIARPTFEELQRKKTRGILFKKIEFQHVEIHLNYFFV